MGDFSIQISSNLVNSLTIGEEKSKKKPKRTKPKLPRESQPKTNQTQVSDKSPASTGWPIQTPVFLPAPPPPPPAIAELEVIRTVLQESERVVEKLQKQEENMAKEVTERAKELREKEFKLPYQKPLPCVAETEACLACYKEHLKDPLKCADLVRSFADCARRVRQLVSSAQ